MANLHQTKKARRYDGGPRRLFRDFMLGLCENKARDGTKAGNKAEKKTPERKTTERKRGQETEDNRKKRKATEIDKDNVAEGVEANRR